MSGLERLKGATARLETAALLLTLLALLFRATLYWQLPAGSEGGYGSGDLLDLGLALILFLVCCACAACGVAISLLGEREDKRLAYRAALVGMLSFIAYDFAHPYVPRLM